MPLCVWSAARFPTFLAALHALALGAGGAAADASSARARSQILPDPVHAVLVAQLFLVAVLLTGLAVGTLGDRIDELVATHGPGARPARPSRPSSSPR